MQHGDELDITLHVVDARQESERNFYFYCIEEVLSLVYMRLDRTGSQRAAHHLTPELDRSEEDGDILCPGLSYGFRHGVVELSPYYRLHKACYVFSFRFFLAELFDRFISLVITVILRIGFFLSGVVEEHMDFRHEVVFRRTVIDTGIKHRTLVISFHDVPEHMVDVSDGSIVGPEILSQVYCDAVRIASGSIFFIKSFKDLRLCLSEFIDALLHVADPEHVVRTCDPADQVLLYVVRILIFIYEYEPESSAERVCSLVILEYADRNVLHVCKVYDSLLTLFGVISPLEFLEHAKIIDRVFICIIHLLEACFKIRYKIPLSESVHLIPER